MFSLEDGRQLVGLARRAVEKYFEKGKLEIEETKFREKRGVFTSIHTYPERILRGCIGYPYPEFQLGEGVQRSAFCAAFQDPRFEPLKKEELDNVIFEISILTKPQLISVRDPEEYRKKIKIGKDGVLLVFGSYSSLLLPQVAIEFGWDVETFLSNLCLKAGLPAVAWKFKEVKIYRFQAQIFSEKRPKGEIVEL